jgi:tetratricopeptide (TPR) repeat protein
MSDSESRSTRPPRPGAGVSGPPGTIGKALGGDLDFEPDALLDSLVEENAPSVAPPARPAPPSEPTVTDSEPPAPSANASYDASASYETLRPSYGDEEVTLVAPREAFEGSAPRLAPAPPAFERLPSGPDSTTKTPLLERPPERLPAPPRPAAGLRAPPTIPRPAGTGTLLSVRPALSPNSVTPPLGQRATNTPVVAPFLTPLAPKNTDSISVSADGSESAPPIFESENPSSEPSETGWTEPPDDSTRTSLTADEIAALDELESLGPPEAHVRLPNARIAPAPAPLPSIASVPPPRVNAGPTLPRAGEPDEWTVRAEWMESEARSLPDAQARSRALVVASEIWALAGNLERARRAAQDASTAGRAPMAGRQLRWLAGAGGDWKTVASTLELELRGSSTAEARAHAAYLDAEVQRLCLADDAAAEQRLELGMRAQPEDPRGHLARIARALGKSAQPPSVQMPNSPMLASFEAALAETRRLRAGGGSAGGQGAAAAFAITRRALMRGDRDAAAEALGELGAVEGLAGAAAWLGAALLTHAEATRRSAADRLRALSEGPDAISARRALAARALELADPALLEVALDLSEDAFTAADRLVLRALTERAATDIDSLAELVNGDELAPLAAGTLAEAGLPTPEAGSNRSRTAAALGRAFVNAGGDATLSKLAPALDAFFAEHEKAPLTRLLRLERAATNGRPEEVAEALASWGTLRDDGPSERDRSLAQGLVLEIAGDKDGSLAAYRAASEADAGFEAALRAQLESLDAEAQADALTALADASNDPAHAALTLIEAALKGSESDPRAVDERLKRAVALDPAQAIAFRIGEQRARAAGDAERLVEWLKARRELSNDDVDRSLDLVREALLVSDQEPARAAELLEQAISAHPGDVGLRELHERMMPGGVGRERGVWREAAAEHAAAKTRPLLLLQAAFEYERAGDRSNAARTARIAAESGSPLSQLIAHRTAAGTPEAALVTEALIERARSASDPTEQRELYEQLSELDGERGDTASVVRWQSAILEGSPESLPALRYLEQAYALDREAELEGVASRLARLLPDAEGVAHARLAARLRLKTGNWSGRRELAELAATRDPSSIWALRALAAHARAADEPEKALDAYRRLFEIAPHPLDQATLALRAAEAAARLGRFEEAKTLLESCLERTPDHVVGLTTLSEVLEALRDYPGAARALEVVAESSQVDAHRVGAWHQAAVVWLERVNDAERGRAALEHALALEPAHEDAAARLQTLLIDAGDRQALAALLARRISLATDAEERVALEVQRGKLLAGVGENAAAKAALTAALDANPDHAGALEALAELSSAEGDWSGAEQALIRLVRHTPEPARQVQIYRKLGELYDTNLPNLERADLAYQEVLKREPNDALATDRLIQVAAKLGQSSRSLDLQIGLLERAVTREEKRDRTLGLALVFEQIVKDPKRADATFDRARKEWPQDVVVLRALVEHHRRKDEQRAAQVLLDRAATDARRALATGRFEAAQFELLGTVADLRGFADVALVAEATLAALAGQPFPVRGAGFAAAKSEHDELLAPELVTPALRKLLQKTGEVLDTAYGLDLRTLRATPLPAAAEDLGTQVAEIAGAFGLTNVEVLVSPVLGATCLATRSQPPQIVYGNALIERGDDASRYFLLVRALKLIQARAATVARTVPTDLGPVVSGYLSALADYNPEGVDPKRLADAQKRVKAAIPKPYQGDVPMLALEVVGSLGSRASQLATALNQWASRTALLAVGNPLTAVRALALASGAEPPSEGPERLRWLARHAEVRDLAIFSVSDGYAELRRRTGAAS